MKLETCKELDSDVIDMAVNVDHVHLFVKTLLEKAFTKLLRNVLSKKFHEKCFANPPKYSVSWIRSG